MGVREDGSKELIAVEDGCRESTESWSEVLRDLKRRGLQPPALAIADGALGFWYHKGIIKAVGDVWPETKQQRCWVHKLGNILERAACPLETHSEYKYDRIYVCDGPFASTGYQRSWKSN